MKRIKLTKGQYALVSDHRYDELNGYKWSASWHPTTQSYYAVRNENGSRIRMNRQIMNTPKGMICDHINHDTLDNQDHNLRNISQADSLKNRRAFRTNKLGQKNIHFDKRRGKYRIAIVHDGRTFEKYASDLETAIRIRDENLAELHGEFACGSGC